MWRNWMIGYAVVGLLSVLTIPASGATPNVILVMCDDLGYGDLTSFNKSTPIQTPHLTQMCRDGMKFTRFYAAAPVCSPTRGSCLTGRHPFRYGIYHANTGHLPKEEITLPELLKQRGYRTGHFGKWHLGTLTTTIKDSNRGGPGSEQHFSPPRWHGYDDSFVTEAKVPTYDPMIKPVDAPKTAWDSLTASDKSTPYGTRFWDHQGNEVTDNLRGDDSRIIMDRAIPFIKASVAEEKPFFAAIWFHAPHLPVVAGPEHREPYADASVYQRNYYGCITALDEQVGRLRQTLSDLGVADDTMLWFCSDNGPEGQANRAPGSAAEFRGRKRSLYEGGVRVPGILVWPSEVKPATVTEFPAVTSDYLPTVLEATGIPFPDNRPRDGQSLMPVIRGEVQSRVRPIGFQSAKQIAWHDGHDKLFSGDGGKSWELYDLKNDPGETRNLADSRPDRVRRLIADVTRWQKSCEVSDKGLDY